MNLDIVSPPHSGRTRLATCEGSRMRVSAASAITCPRDGLAKREFHATNPSIRGSERIRNADADLAIVADRAGVKRQEDVFHHVLREGLAGSRIGFHKARLVL